MGIRSILVHLDQRANTRQRVAAAAALAIHHDARLVGQACVGWVGMPVDPSGTVDMAAYQQVAMDSLNQQAQGCVQRFQEQAQALGVTSYEGRVDAGFAVDTMTLVARYCDLTVVTQTAPEEWLTLASPQMPQDVLLRSGRPLLVLPYVGEFPMPPERVLVGWNASREAARALQDALPLLKHARVVEVVVFETPEDVGRLHGAVPGADIGLWLARHGVNVEVRYVPTKVGAGEALLSHAADMGADLIVTGGYGHSRIREAVLGGVTRTLLRSAPVPVLMSH